MDEHLQMIEDCEARESRLDEWECGFIDSMRIRIENGKRLTVPQAEKMEEIWTACTAKG